MQRDKDMKLCREGDNRELSIRKDLHRFPIFLCASWNTRPACREFCCYFNIIFEVMQLFFKLLQRWQSRLGERGLPLHGGGEKARHHECPQWGLLNWSGHLRKEVIGVWGLWPFLHPEWHQRMLRNIIGASSRRSFLCFWVQSDDWWSDGCQYSLWTKLRLIRLNLNLIVKAICSSLRWRSWNKMSKIEFVLVFLNFLKNCEANVIKDPEK